MDGDLVRRAQTGDHEAFTALAANAISRLHRTARLILRDDDRASDAVQDALTTAWLDIRAVRDPERFDAWLHRLLVRACYREAGRSRRRWAVEAKVMALDVPVTQDGLGDQGSFTWPADSPPGPESGSIRKTPGGPDPWRSMSL